MALLTAADLRAVPLLDNDTKFPDAVLEELVAEFEAVAARFLDTALAETETEVTVRGTSSQVVELPVTNLTAVSEASVDGSTVTDLSDVTVRSRGALVRSGGWWGDWWTFTVTHGLADDATELPVLRRACREFVRAKAIESQGNQPRNTLSYSDDQGWSYRESTADWDAGRPTGLMVVDQALDSLRSRAPLVG